MLRVDDGGPQKVVRKTYKVTVRDPNTAEKNTAPLLSKISSTWALVDHELTLPILATDRDGDSLTITPEDKGPFERGATFDTATNTMHWVPGCLDGGRRTAVFHVNDGAKTKKLKVTIEVFFPLFWEDETAPG